MRVTIPRGARRVAAIGAHPDDIEIGCGATLLSLAARGDAEIRSFVLTGTPARQDEARAAAERFGSTSVSFGGFADARLPSVWDDVKTALHAFRSGFADVDIVLAPRVDDAHQDHALLGSLVSTVWRGPLILHYEIPKWDGDLGRPNAYVPVSDELAARKVALLNESFPSQHAHHWWDDEFFLALMRLRGAETATRYAEAFTVSKIALDLA